MRAYMRLYSAMPLKKLASFLDMDEANIAALLLCYQSKTRQLVLPDGQPPLAGVMTGCSDLQYSLDGEMMHMQEDAARPNLYADTFLKHIVKFHELIQTIEGRPLQA